MQLIRVIIALRYKTDLQRSIANGVLFGVFLSVTACGPSDSDFTEFDTFYSPDEKHRVVVEMAPKNSFAFSPETIRFQLAEQGTSERYLLGTTSLANDGSRIMAENIRATWIDSKTVRICLSGAEQDDEAIVIDVLTASFSVESAKCAN